MNRTKRKKNAIVKIYVFWMLQMISIQNLECVLLSKDEQDEEYLNSRLSNHRKDLWAEKRYSLDHFHMLWDWLFKVLINITPIHRTCFKFSSLFAIIYRFTYLKTKLSNTIFVLELWLIEIGLWHQQRVVNKTKLLQLNSMTTQFSFLMITSMKSFQLFFTFIKIWMCALFEQLQICRR